MAAPPGCCDANPTIRRMDPMDWSRIAGNWTHWRGRVRERWGRLTDDHLDVIAGRREQLTGRIQELYGIEKDEAERQLRNWERNLTVEMDTPQITQKTNRGGTA